MRSEMKISIFVTGALKKQWYMQIFGACLILEFSLFSNTISHTESTVSVHRVSV